MQLSLEFKVMSKNPDIMVKMVGDDVVSIFEYDKIVKELFDLRKKYPFISDIEIIWNHGKNTKRRT